MSDDEQDVSSRPVPSLVAPPLKLAGVDLSHLTPAAQFAVLCGGVFVGHVGHGMMQEYLFKSIEGFHFGLYLTFFELCGYLFFARLEQQLVASTTKRRTSLWYYAMIALILNLGQSLGNQSLQYLNYPTKVVFRSSKLIPVMAAGYFILGRTYNAAEYASALTMTLGLCVFSLADASVSPSFNPLGLALVLSSVVFEALLSNFQEKILQVYKAPQYEMVLWSNAFALLISAGSLVVSGELFTGSAFIAANPSTLPVLIAEACMGYFGVYFYLAIIKRFGAVMGIFVACLRKALTILLSFLLFPKPFTWRYPLGAALVFAGIFLNVYAKNPDALTDTLTQLAEYSDALRARVVGHVRSRRTRARFAELKRVHVV